jgi:hypothetical protein
MKTTFSRIRENEPCTSGWRELVEYYNPEDYKQEISIEQILKSNGIKDAVWALRCIDDENSVLLFCADVAESVLDIFEKERPDDKRPRAAILAIRRYVKKEISVKELTAAAYAAYTCAYDTAIDAAIDAACAANCAAYACAHDTACAATSAADGKWEEIETILKKYLKR